MPPMFRVLPACIVMPVLLSTGPPLIVRLSAVRAGVVAIVMSLPLRVTAMF